MSKTVKNKKASDELLLNTGGKGKTGRRIAERLAQAGRNLRLGSRRGAPPFDWQQPETWGPCLEGATAAYVAYQPDLAVPGALETLRGFFEQALSSGVGKLVLLSGRGEGAALNAEQALQATGADWTILRASWFCQNFSEGVFRDPLVTGELALPVDSVAEPFVDCEDIADIAFAALTGTEHSGRLYELTGLRALTFAQAVEEIAQATGREIRFISVSADEYRAELKRAGVPHDSVDLILYLFTTVLDGRNTPVADGVQRALGRPARDFAAYLREAAGIWADRQV